MSIKISLVSFASDSWSKAAKRFIDQANNTKIFTNIKIFDENFLEHKTLFFKENSNFLKIHPLGFGGWVWKPYILEWAFKEFYDSDYIMYLDIGSEFNINENSIKRFYDYVEYANNNNIFGFRNRDLEQNLTHCSVIENIYSGAKNTRQFEANTLIFKNNIDSLNVIKEWKNFCLENNYFNIYPKDLYNCCNMWGGTHLHDQSILSCLLKNKNIEGVSDEASWYLPGYSISPLVSENIKKYPIFTARNPFNYSIIKKCVKYKEFSICQHNKNKICKDFLVVR